MSQPSSSLNPLDDPEAQEATPEQSEEEEEWQQQPAQEEQEKDEKEKPRAGLITIKKFRNMMSQHNAERKKAARASAANKVKARNAIATTRWHMAVCQSELDVITEADVPGWASQAHPSHQLIHCGGVLACERCALQACKPRQRLADQCKGEYPKGSDRDLKRLRKAQLPKSLRAWPRPESASKARRLA